MSEYTKEPWVLRERKDRFESEFVITTADRDAEPRVPICGGEWEFDEPFGNEQRANARRIVACVNALSGFKTEDLEKLNGVMFGTKEHLAKVMDERDQLRARITELEAQQRAGVPEGGSHEDLAELLLSIGWKAISDAQWERLLMAMPRIREMLSAPAPKAQERECLTCMGSGEHAYFDGAGPDGYDVTGPCGSCGGTGAASGQAPQPAEVGADERAILSNAIGSVLFNATNYPPAVQAKMLGQDFSPLREKVADAVLQACAQLAEGAALREENDRLWETFVTLADKLGIDAEAARKAPGKPSDVFWNAIQALTAAGGRDELTAVLFDGYAVYSALDDRAKYRTSPENVSDTLDAVVRLIKAASQPAQEKPE